LAFCGNFLQLRQVTYCLPVDLHDNVAGSQAALRWVLSGCGYDLTGTDVLTALHFMMQAAARTGQQSDAITPLRELMERKGADEWVVNILQSTSYFSEHET